MKMKTVFDILVFVLKIVGMGIACLSVLFLIDWLSRSIVADIVGWILLLLGPILGLRWALK